ncbi:MAG: hypothetical protein NT154_04535, partial [Verrucomicrobia bacterium]|nr:hypothetical protein [Verrucomicrobiota bacterium]
AMDHIRWSAQHRDFVSTETLGSTHLQDLRFTHGTRFLYSQVYMHQLDDGIQLLRRHADPSMRLVAPLFANPFHVALGLLPAKGGLSCWSWNTINRRSHPPLARLIGDATHILLPTDQGHAQKPREVYGAEWDALGLETVEETTYYTLLKLRSPTDTSSKH